METFLLEIIVQIARYFFETPWQFLVPEVCLIVITLMAFKRLYFAMILRVSGRHHTPTSFVSGCEKKILLAGDSTAVGTGSVDTSQTIAGFLKRDFPHFDIVNVAVNGALTQGVHNQFKLVSDTKFSEIIISTGGNDVWSFTSLKKLEAQLKLLIAEAKKMTDGRIIFLFFGNEGSAPFFPFIIRWFIMYRTEQVRQVFSKVVAHEKVYLVELFSTPEENPFVRNPKAFFAPDGLHPNDKGYWEWYKHLWYLMTNVQK